MTRTKQQKSEFVSSVGTVFEFVKAISDEVQALGGSDNDLRKVISQSDLRRRVAETIMSQAKKFPSEAIARKYGYTVVEDVEPKLFDIGDFSYTSFLKAGEESVSGETMRRRAVELKANFGLADAQYFLDHQDEILINPYIGRLIFPGTLLRKNDGATGVAYLYRKKHSDGRWRLRCRWIDDDCYVSDYYQLACYCE